MSNGFSYTEEQWNDIADSLSALKETSEADLAQLRMELLWSINIPLLTDDHIRDGYRENAAAAQDALRTIRKLVKSIGHRRHNPGDDVGRSVQQTLPHLFRIYRSAQADIRRSRAVSAGARAPNQKPEVRRLLATIADAWTRLGGTIGHGRAYREFFTACAKPPIESLKMTWGAFWTDGMFRNHVSELMRMTGQVGTRGRKRTIQRSPSIVGPQN